MFRVDARAKMPARKSAPFDAKGKKSLQHVSTRREYILADLMAASVQSTVEQICKDFSAEGDRYICSPI